MFGLVNHGFVLSSQCPANGEQQCGEVKLEPDRAKGFRLTGATIGAVLLFCSVHLGSLSFRPHPQSHRVPLVPLQVATFPLRDIPGPDHFLPIRSSEFENQVRCGAGEAACLWPVGASVRLLSNKLKPF